MRVTSKRLQFAHFAALIAVTLAIAATNVAAIDVIRNGNFDEQLSGWNQFTISGAGSISISTNPVCVPTRAGNPAAALDTHFGGVRAIEQTVTLPLGIATLSFTVFGQLQPTTLKVVVFDEAQNRIEIGSLTPIRVIDHYTFPGPVYTCTDALPESKTFDLSSYAGRTIRLRFEGSGAGNDGTFSIIDDVKLEVGSVAPTPTPDGTSTPDPRRATGTTVLCNRGPDPKDNFSCTATVGSQDKQPPNPSGIVEFSSAKGSFPFGSQCVLTANTSPGTSSVAFCSATYSNPEIKAGEVVPVIASYQGDTIYAPSSNDGKLPKSTVARLPKLPKVCFSEAPSACKGLNAIIDPNGLKHDGIGYVSAGYFGPDTVAPQNPNARKLRLSAPKTKSSIAVQFSLAISAKENQNLASIDALKSFSKQLKNGLTLGGTKTTIKFAETKNVSIKFKPAAQKFLDAVIAAGITNLNVNFQVESIRKGDSKSSKSKTVKNLPIS